MGLTKKTADRWRGRAADGGSDWLLEKLLEDARDASNSDMADDLRAAEKALRELSRPRRVTRLEAMAVSLLDGLVADDPMPPCEQLEAAIEAGLWDRATDSATSAGADLVRRVREAAGAGRRLGGAIDAATVREARDKMRVKP